MDRAELADCLGLRHAGRSCRHSVVCESDPKRFQSAFASGVAAGGKVFLADPKWTPAEMAEFDRLRIGAEMENPEADAMGDLGWLYIPTGGTGGRLKLARHDERTIDAAVRGFARHFLEERIYAFGVLPLHHVSGLMAWLRCAMTGGNYTAGDWTSLQAGELPEVLDQGAYLSLVPTQLQRLLASEPAVRWLKSFRAVFVGGGPSWPDLLDRAASAGVPLVISYGMTETAAMVAAQQPGDFLAGDRSCGRNLPHARISTDVEGVVRVTGESVFRGYAGGPLSHTRQFETVDVGKVDPHGRLWIEGRRDQIIITGGEKVDPLEVEAVLRGTGEFSDVVVVGVDDPVWGQRVIACYEDAKRSPDINKVRAAIECTLASYRRPKRFVPIMPWPRSSLGKVNRLALRRALEEIRSASTGEGAPGLF